MDALSQTYDILRRWRSHVIHGPATVRCRKLDAMYGATWAPMVRGPGSAGQAISAFPEAASEGLRHCVAVRATIFADHLRFFVLSRNREAKWSSLAVSGHGPGSVPRWSSPCCRLAFSRSGPPLELERLLA